MDCFGRQQEITAFWDYARSGDNLLLLAPRRVGKTVVINHMAETASREGFRAVLFDAEGLSREKDFFRNLCSKIQGELTSGDRIVTSFTNRMNKMLKGDGVDVRDWRQWLLEIDWQEFADHLVMHLNSHSGDGRWLIMVDEFPVFVQALLRRSGTDAVREFLYWMRRIRQRCRNVTWLYTGSIGLDSVARSSNLEGALNDLRPVGLDAFDPLIATSFLRYLAMRRGCVITDEACARTIQRLGWLSPYYLERVCEAACARVGQRGAVSVGDAEAAMDQMLELGKRLYWAAWREHLERNFVEPIRGLLYAILADVAKAKSGLTYTALLVSARQYSASVTEADVRDQLDILVSDGFLAVRDGTFNFRMGLLREWWLRYVVEYGYAR